MTGAKINEHDVGVVGSIELEESAMFLVYVYIHIYIDICQLLALQYITDCLTGHTP